MRAVPALVLLCWLVIPEVGRVIDGDTFEAAIPIWLASAGTIVVQERVRLLGVDTPELGEPHGVAAKRFTAEWLTARTGQVSMEVCARDSFGRVLAVVRDRGTGEDLAAALEARGLVKGGHP
jgi:endonuclease YncB( thermonuclease family)